MVKSIVHKCLQKAYHSHQIVSDLFVSQSEMMM